MERGWKPNVEISPPCPRCGSSNTKFCYYNNYSLTQPRYFCKGCRRYWTKGGSLRNVPIGGGCRKSRRGKSIRVSTDHGGVNSRNSAHNRVESSSSINSAEASTSNIDLAAVYANFLNQAPRPDQNQIESVSELAPDRIVNVIPTTFEFSSFQLSPHLPQENVFYECGQFPARLSETPLFGPGNGNSTFFGGIDAFQKQQFTTGNSLMSINHMENDHMMLPPLPGEEVVMSEGMVWPNSDVILPNQILPSNQEIIRSEVQLPTEENSEVLINGNESTFSGLNLEAIFRS